MLINKPRTVRWEPTSNASHALRGSICGSRPWGRWHASFVFAYFSCTHPSISAVPLFQRPANESSDGGQWCVNITRKAVRWAWMRVARLLDRRTGLDLIRICHCMASIIARTDHILSRSRHHDDCDMIDQVISMNSPRRCEWIMKSMNTCDVMIPIAFVWWLSAEQEQIYFVGWVMGTAFGASKGQPPLLHRHWWTN